MLERRKKELSFSHRKFYRGQSFCFKAIVTLSQLPNTHTDHLGIPRGDSGGLFDFNVLSGSWLAVYSALNILQIMKNISVFASVSWIILPESNWRIASQFPFPLFIITIGICSRNLILMTCSFRICHPIPQNQKKIWKLNSIFGSPNLNVNNICSNF